MLRLIVGRARNGKTTRVFEMLKTGPHSRHILIVPETSSHEMERALCEALGGKIPPGVDVFTFRRLENRVFSEAGGLAETYLDDGGRLLNMRLSVRACAPSLKIYHVMAKNPEFIKTLVGFVDELKSCELSAENLFDAAEKTEGMLKAKLSDMALIYSEYLRISEGVAADPRDAVTRLAERIPECAFLQGCEICFDGFSGFTAQEFSVISALLKKCAAITVTLTGGGLGDDENEPELFEKTRNTARKLLYLAEKEGIDHQITILPVRSGEHQPELAHLERNFFHICPEHYPNECKAIKLYRASTRFSECVRAASEIRRLVSETGCRYRDIMLVSRNMKEYAQLLETVFERYEVPLFLSDSTDIVKKPVIFGILCAFDVLKSGFSHDAVFRFLRSAFVDLDFDAVNMTENYVLLWKIRGNIWLSEHDFSFNPDGYTGIVNEETADTLARINSIRRAVKNMFGAFKKDVESALSGHQYIMALYRFLQRCDFAKNVERRAYELKEAGKLLLSDEYSQLYEILIAAMEQFDKVLSESPLIPDEFYAYFKMLVSSYKVSSIPVSVDRVTAVAMDRISERHPKYLFLLGANDGAIPRAVSSEGLFSDSDRKLLRIAGVELNPTTVGALVDEQFLLYKTFSTAGRGLFVSCPLFSDVNTLSPSYIYPRLEEIFSLTAYGDECKDNWIYTISAKGPCLDAAYSAAGGAKDGVSAAAHSYFQSDPCHSRKLAEAKNFLHDAEGSMRDREIPKRLYSSQLRLSASRIERYYGCRFSYFMRFGLSAKPRREDAFSSMEAGTFIHYVLENTIRDMVLEKRRTGRIEGQAAQAAAQEHIEKYISDMLGGFEGKTSRFVYLFRRLEKSALAIVNNVLEEISNSEFIPLDFELALGDDEKMPPPVLSFEGGTLTVNGIVDRVDGYVKDKKLYIRVIDYKTGKKVFSLTDAWNGLNLQMLLYLFTIAKNGYSKYKEKAAEIFGTEIGEIVPAGVLYIPASEPVVMSAKVLTDEEHLQLVEKQLRRSGVLIGDIPILEAMEKNLSGEGRFIPVRFNTGGALSPVSQVLSEQRFKALEKRIESLIKKMGGEIMRGEVAPNPVYRGISNEACGFCDYSEACYFEDFNPECEKRYLFSVTDEIWQNAEKEMSVKEGGGSGL